MWTSIQADNKITGHSHYRTEAAENKNVKQMKY